MSTAKHAVAERRPGRSRGRDKPPPRPKPPTAGTLQVSIHELDLIATQSPSEAKAHALLDLALAEPVQTLPYATVLEQRFGRPLGWVQVRSGPLVRDTLAALGAQAATRGDTVFLRDRSAPLDVVAHEVTHALQGRLAADPTAAAGVVAENAPAEAEAAVVASGASAPATLRSPVRPAEGLAPSAIALLRPAPGAAADPAISLEPVASSPAPSIAAPTVAAPAAPTVAPAAPATPAAGPVTELGVSTADSGEPFALPASTELTVSPEEVAARETAMAEAAAALASAASAGDLLHAYADAAPTVKAQQAAALSSHLNTAVAGETQEWQSAVPELEAHLPGETGPAPAALRVEAPPAAAVVLEPDPVAPAPEPDLADAPAPAPFTANDRVSGAFSQLTAPPPEQLADTIGDTLSQVQTSDPSVPRTPGPPPPIPLGGETDPARIAGQADATTTQAAAARDGAARAIVDGPGPEQVQPVAVQQAYAVEPVEPPAPAPLVAPPGPDAYLALNLPPQVATAFDEQQQAAMQESMATATAKADEVTVARDAARDEAVSTAEAGAAELNQKAEHDQTAAVTDARSTIQTERQSSIDAQHAEVGRIKTGVADRRRADEEHIDTRVRTEQQEIDKSYAKGETDIANQVAEGERKAATEREKAERDAENESWWDRAVSFVKDAFNALVSAIGDIFDAVRQAVNAALDALKAFALSVIDRVASFIKDAIALFGEFLKFAVDTLIGTFFPELAAKLNAAIDSAVAKAQAAVDVVANGLKAGISALVEGLRAGINAAINAFEAGISIAVSFVAAALTGDWGMLAKKVLEGVLRLIGVDPETFYAFVGRAQETFDIIINDPMGFLSNLVSAVVGGVQGFADRFGEHLKKGVIGWLTGTLGGAGITLPATFDLMGVLDLARQILGLTWERLRAKAVKLIGEKNVARLEFIGGYITTLINEGWSGLWTKIMADLSGLLDMVFEGIKSFLLERVVLAMIKKIPALFGPVGAIVQLVMTAWNLYTFLRDKLAALVALVQSVVDSIGDIARGVLTAAVAKVEQVLSNLLPLALDLLARILGLGNVGEDVKKIIEKVQAFIDKAIDGLINKVIGLVTGKGTGGAAAPDPTVRGEGAAGQAKDTFAIADEEHTIRAVGPDGSASVQLASGPFGDLVQRITDVVAKLKVTYTTAGGAKYVGDAQAPKIGSQLDALVVTAQTLVSNVIKEKDKTKEHALIVAGIASLKKQSTALNKTLGIKNPAAASPGTSAPGIGDATAYGAKPPKQQSGRKKIHFTEAEHIIPYKIGDSLLAVVDLSTGSRPKSRKFDGAMLTLVIYEPAASEKTTEDLKIIKRFGAALATAKVRDRLVGSVMREQGGGGDRESDGRAAFGELVGAIQEVRRDAAERTKVAIHHDHEAILDGTNMTNGLRRGEKSAIPDDAKVEKTSHEQYDQLFGLAQTFVEQRGDQPIDTEPPTRNVVTSISLAELNEWSVSKLTLVQGIGQVRANSIWNYIRDNRPFATREEVLNVRGIGPRTLESIRG